MKALILGFVVIAVAVLAVLPAGLDWGDDVAAFLRGSLPVVAILISFILFFVGIADIKDRAASKKDKISAE
ncbi:MAG: hypothetical protein LBG93_05065 [Treponema sp.]|jgi:uncharacterized membrane protein YozB (DUF420 family)|nr:hypothetical protein [Treponema sp.]